MTQSFENILKNLPPLVKTPQSPIYVNTSKLVALLNLQDIK